MKEMTTAEFAKANLAALAEPVTVRRYTNTVGTYYPEGFEPAVAPSPSQIDLDFTSAAVDVAVEKAKDLQKRVEQLEEDNRHLKKELAARPPAVVDAVSHTTVPRTAIDPIRPRSASANPFDGLPKQDREFFERKLGTKKK
jgi:hypothetical protein